MNQIMKVIKELENRWKYDSCYSDMEYTGHASFGNCSGLETELNCLNCPYYIRWKEGLKI